MNRGGWVRGGLAAFMVGTALPGSGWPGPCEGPDADAWVVEAGERARSYDGLLRFSIEEFGPPVECDGKVTDEFDGGEFGMVLFRFSAGTTFEIETMPPSVGIVTLRHPVGFDDPAKVLEAVRRYATGLGLSIDWEDPERSSEGQERTERYWDPDPGLNASVSLTWSAGSLLAVRVSLAP